MTEVGLVILIIIGALLLIAAKVLIMLAVGSDAKALGVKDRVIWMVLAFFVPSSAIAYACVRKDLKKEIPNLCTKCRQYVPAEMYQCPHCGGSSLAPCEHAQAKQLKKSAKHFTIAGAIAMAVAAVLVYAGYFGILFSFISDPFYFDDLFDDDYGYYEYDEDDPFGFYEDYFDDYEDHFDDFNDFSN